MGSRPITVRPGVLRLIFGGMRLLSPALPFGGKVYVTRHADLVDVLAREGELSVTGVYAQKMSETSGDFFLGMDDGERYRREQGITRRVAKRSDLDRIRQITRAHAESIVGQARRSGGRIDVVDELTREVPIRLLGDYFGVRARDPAEMRRWMRDLFLHLFFNPGGDQGHRRRALAAAEELRPYMLELCASPPGSDTLLDRMVALRDEGLIDDDFIVRNIAGLIIGAVDTTSKAAVHALGVLLRRQSRLDGARAAARGRSRDRLLHYIYEALRFDPFNPVMMRSVPAPTTVGSKGRWVDTDKQVWLAPVAAMFDERVFEEPRQFRTDRMLSSYLHFGFATHACFGSRINRVTLPEILAPLLAGDWLRPVPGKRGKVSWDRIGQFPDHWWLEVSRP